MQLFGTSGIRRIADRNLLELSWQVGLAMGGYYGNVIVGRDTRTSGSAIYHALASGILAAGGYCNDAGILPTPTLALTAREFAAGVMITASHNPPQYNGLKLLNPDGSAFSIEQQIQIEDLVNNREASDINWGKMKTSQTYAGAVKKHIERIILDFPQETKIKVVVDCGCGAAYSITPQALSRMGCELVPLNCYANGIFPHDVEPIEANLTELMNQVRETKADLGIAHDGDADRMMAVDNLGRFISGDKLLAIFAKASGSRDIVTTIDASMSIDELGFNVERTRVGDPYVSEALKKGGGFGGEPSGAWIFPQISLCPDGIFAAAKIAWIASRQKLSEMVDALPSYPVVRGNVNGKVSNLSSLANKLTKEMSPLAVSNIDGIKLTLEDGWMLVRASGTEPKIRISTEAKDGLNARRNYEKGVKIISDCIRENH